jgi:hypothetical protein
VNLAFSSSLKAVVCVPLPVSPVDGVGVVELPDGFPDELPPLAVGGGAVVPVAGGVLLVLPVFDEPLLPEVSVPAVVVVVGVVGVDEGVVVVSVPLAVVVAGAGDEVVTVEVPPLPPHAAISRERKRTAAFLARKSMIHTRSIATWLPDARRRSMQANTFNR